MKWHEVKAQARAEGQVQQQLRMRACRQASQAAARCGQRAEGHRKQFRSPYGRPVAVLAGLVGVLVCGLIAQLYPYPSAVPGDYVLLAGNAPDGATDFATLAGAVAQARPGDTIGIGSAAGSTAGIRIEKPVRLEALQGTVHLGAAP